MAKTIQYFNPTSSANFVVLENGMVRSFKLEEQERWVIGRVSDGMNQDIKLESRIASREHGTILSIDGDWYYKEESLNGTYHNGKKLMKERNDIVRLRHGDVLRIGSKKLANSEVMGVWMMFTTGSIGDKWRAVKLERTETYFGRSEELSDVIIPLPYISGHHLTITRRDDGYYIKDCDSMAGTWVNGVKLESEVRLNEKDMILICDCIMVFTGNKIIYNIPRRVEISETRPGDFGARSIILKADIKSRKVPSNTGHGMKELIRNVRVEVQEGTLVALLGGSGAGKTTVMNCMNGMDTAGMTGTVEYNGVDLLKNFDRMKYLIGSVPQMETFHEMLTVEQELTHAAKHRLPGDTKRAEIKERVDHTLKQLGIESIRKNTINKCCGGERRRVNIGIELVADRQLLCLDEPEAGLDPGNKRKLFETLRSLAHDEGKSILTIIHDVSDIELFDKVIIMNKVGNVGRLAFEGTPEQARIHFGVELKDVYQLMAKNPEKYVIE